MARRCDICGKGPQFGYSVSHSNRATKRVRYPNLHIIKRKTANGVRKLKVCTGCLKKLEKTNLWTM
uniref:Large ribosomal subunit protein bL28 n=1 Tax=candidate division WOR-3 bacterium TaxID=2052148 RepID=A0A7C3UXN1_UNCW3